MRLNIAKIFASWQFLGKHFAAENSSINRQMAGSLGLLVVGMLVAALLPSVGIVYMGAVEYGQLEFTTSLTVLVALVASLGIDAYALRHIPPLVAAGAPTGILRLMGLGIATSVLVAEGVALVLHPLAQTDANSVMATIQVLLMPLAAGAYFLSFCVQCVGSRVVGALLRNALLPTLMLMLFMVFLGLRSNAPIHAEMVVLAAVLYYALAIGAAVWFMLRRLAGLSKVPAAVDNIDRSFLMILKNSLPMLVFSSSFLVVNQTDVIMIGLFLSSHEVSNFAFAAKLAALPSIGLLAVNILIPPLISQFASSDCKAEMQALMIAFSSFAAIVYLAVATLVLPLALFLAGWADVSGWQWVACLAVLLVGQIFNVFTGSCGYLLTMTGHQGIAARSTAVAAFANVALNLVFVPLIGIVGAALATAATVAISNVYMARRAATITGVQPSFLLAF